MIPTVMQPHHHLFPMADAACRFPSAAKLSATMVRQTPLGAADDGAHGSLPAAYTYLGQFVAHDLSMGVPSPSMAAGDPAGSIGLRRPALNLDSLYGGGPVLQPYLFERSDSGQFRLGTLREGSREDLGDAQSRFDVPRLDDGQAVIAEPRNDQTLLIGQLHVALLAFHNRVKTKLPGASDAARFHAARREVCWHYQWLVVHDWLARVLAPGTVLRVLDEGPRLCPKRDASMPATIPLEFSAAAFRFGHTLARDSYRINQVPLPAGVDAHIPLFIRGDATGSTPPYRAGSDDQRTDLRGGVAVRNRDVLDWSLFAETGAYPPQFQKAAALNTLLAPSLRTLPAEPQAAERTSSQLAIRTLERGEQLRLGSGQSVARIARQSIPGLEVLDEDAIWDGDARRPFHGMAAPLWFYVLREAEVLGAGQHLGPLGSRLVAEVVLDLLQADRTSWLANDPSWRPALGRTAGVFTLVDLLRVAGMPGTLRE